MTFGADDAIRGEAQVGPRMLPTRSGMVRYADSGWTDDEWRLIASAVERRG